jgi:hypothetical protein
VIRQAALRREGVQALHIGLVPVARHPELRVGARRRAPYAAPYCVSSESPGNRASTGARTRRSYA